MDRLESWLLETAGSPLAFVVVALVLAVGVIVIFLPSESLVVAVAALLLARPDRDLRVPLLVVTAAVGLAAGDVLLFVLARRLRRHADPRSPSASFAALRRRVDRRASNVRARFTEHPWTTMIFMRLVPVGRASSDLVAADASVTLRRFTAYALVGGLVYGAYCVAIAALAYPLVRRYPVESMVGVIVLAVVLSSVVDRVDQRIQRARAARAARHDPRTDAS